MKAQVPDYEVRAVAGGYRIWNRRAHQWWGEFYRTEPSRIVAELNGPCRAAQVRKLVMQARPEHRSPLLDRRY